MTSLSSIKKHSKRLVKIWPEFAGQEEIPLSKAQEFVSQLYGYSSFHAATQAEGNIGKSDESVCDKRSHAESEDQYFFVSDNPVLKKGDFTFLKLAATVDKPRTTQVSSDHPLWRENLLFSIRFDYEEFKGFCYGVAVGGLARSIFKKESRVVKKDLKTEGPNSMPGALEPVTPLAILLMVADEGETFAKAPFTEPSPEHLQILESFYKDYRVIANCLVVEDTVTVRQCAKTHVFEDPETEELIRKITQTGYTEWWERSHLRDLLETAHIGLASENCPMPRHLLENIYTLALQCGSPALYLGAAQACVTVETGSRLQGLIDDLARFHMLAYATSISIVQEDRYSNSRENFEQRMEPHTGVDTAHLMFPKYQHPGMMTVDSQAGEEFFSELSKSVEAQDEYRKLNLKDRFIRTLAGYKFFSATGR